MTPIHHSFEKKGYSERDIVKLFKSMKREVDDLEHQISQSKEPNFRAIEEKEELKKLKKEQKQISQQLRAEQKEVLGNFHDIKKKRKLLMKTAFILDKIICVW